MRYSIKKTVNGEERETVYRSTKEAAAMFIQDAYNRQKEQVNFTGQILMPGSIIKSDCLEAVVTYKLLSNNKVITMAWVATVINDEPEVAFPECLYHITDSEKLSLILEQGLIPGKGSNSKLVTDNDNRLYLCEYQDLPYWGILLGKDKVIKVDTSKLNSEDFQRYSYGKYNEWFTSSPIKPDYIQSTGIFILTSDAMSELCEEYVFSLSDLIVFMIKVGTYPDKYDNVIDIINHDASSLVDVMMNRLDYSSLNDSYIISKLERYGSEGEYTLCDSYCVNDRLGKYQLWEQLVLFDFNRPELEPMKHTYIKVHSFIRDNFKWVYNVSSGGYTG